MPRDYSKHKITRIPVQWCPVCFHKLDSAGSIASEYVPEPGDFMVCIDCGNILRFNQEMITELSCLMDIPVYLRMEFAKVVQAVHALGPMSKWQVM